MTGSVVDVCLALLLVSAAAVTLVGVDTPADGPGRDRPDGVADTLATTTATVEYTLALGEGDIATPEAERIAHATLAEHLARATVRSASVDGETLSPAVAGYRRAVRASVADALGPRTEVRAVWRPLPGTGVEGRVRVGALPPASAAVSAARISVPVGSVDGPTTKPPSPTATVARMTVRVLFPPDRIAAAARDDTPAAAAVAERYRRADDALGTDAAGVFGRDGPRRANRVLAAALGQRAAEAADGTSAAAAETDPAPGRVFVVVRTWSA